MIIGQKGALPQLRIVCMQSIFLALIFLNQLNITVYVGA